MHYHFLRICRSAYSLQRPIRSCHLLWARLSVETAYSVKHVAGLHMAYARTDYRTQQQNRLALMIFCGHTDALWAQRDAVFPVVLTRPLDSLQPACSGDTRCDIAPRCAWQVWIVKDATQQLVPFKVLLRLPSQ